jgi:hypothetical protein
MKKTIESICIKVFQQNVMEKNNVKIMIQRVLNV